MKQYNSRVSTCIYTNGSQGRPERPRKIGSYEPPPPPRPNGGYNRVVDDDGVHKIYIGETAAAACVCASLLMTPWPSLSSHRVPRWAYKNTIIVYVTYIIMRLLLLLFTSYKLKK